MDARESIERAAELHADQEAADAAAEQAQAHESWDEYWRSIEPTPAEVETETICGVTVVVPHSLTLAQIRHMDYLQEYGDESDLREMVDQLFGGEVYETWIENGMTEPQFEVAVAWGIVRSKGRKLSFREAHERLIQGKAARARAQTSTGASKNSGGRSKGGSRRKGGRRKR